MIISNTYKNKRVAVFGLARSGLAAIKSLLAGDAEVIAWDDKVNARDEFARLDPRYAKLLVNLDEQGWQHIDTLILSPGIALYYPQPHPAVVLATAQNAQIICDIELLYQHCPAPCYIGITGTNGKSTTSSLLAHIFKNSGRNCQLGGNIGVSALDLTPLQADDYYVIETSSYQLELLNKTHFTTTILLNITPDHLDRHATMENYIAAKAKIFHNQGQADITIIGIDNSITQQVYQKLLAENNIGQIIPFSTKVILENGVSVINNILYNNIGVAEQLDLGELQYLPGLHNAENIAASFAAGYLNGVSSEQIISAILNFPGLRHRLQYLGQAAKLTFINDSKATNADSTEKALLAFKNNIYWLAGGVAKQGGITSLSPLFSKIKQVFLFGQAGVQFEQEVAGHIKSSLHQDLSEAFGAAVSAALQSGEAAIILLSPACASTDQWKSFEHRGDAFCQLAEKFIQKNGL